MNPKVRRIIVTLVGCFTFFLFVGAIGAIEHWVADALFGGFAEEETLLLGAGHLILLFGGGGLATWYLMRRVDEWFKEFGSAI